MGSRAKPRRPRSQKLCTFVLRSANTVGVGSVRLSKTLIRPLFSATKTRPSGEKRTTVGLVRPLKTTVSWKPLGSVAVCAAAGRINTSVPSNTETRWRRTAITNVYSLVTRCTTSHRSRARPTLGSTRAAPRPLVAPHRGASHLRARPERPLGLARLLDRNRARATRPTRAPASLTSSSTCSSRARARTRRRRSRRSSTGSAASSTRPPRGRRRSSTRVFRTTGSSRRST